MSSKKFLLAIVLAIVISTQSASASTFANYTAKYLVYFTGVKAQILGAIVNTPSLNNTFIYSTASILYDTMRIQASVYALLANYTAGAGSAFPFPFVNFTLNSTLIDFSEFLAIYIYAIQGIKADVMYLLSTSEPSGYFGNYTQAIARELIGNMKIMAKVYEILNNT
jgi:hypothetical protein